MSIAQRAAHQGGHRSEVKSFMAEHLLEDVHSIPVLSIPGILLKLLHVFPVLQRQADLRTRRGDGSGKQLRPQHGCFNGRSISNVSDMLSGHSCLTSMQAVQQIKPSDSDLEAERGEEEATGLVQDQPSESSLAAVRYAATAKEKQRMTKLICRAKNDKIAF